MAGYERLQKAITSAVQEVVRPQMEDATQTKEVGEALLNTYWGDPGPRTVQTTPIRSPLDEFRVRLFREFIEINSSYEALKDVNLYMSRFPYRKTRITRSGHLRYHFEHHMHEIYILQGRLVEFCTRITRAYRNDEGKGRVRTRMDAVIKAIESAVKGIKETRGAHVHQKRFTTQDFDRLEVIEFFEKNPLVDDGDEDTKRLIQRYNRLEYRKIRDKWRQQTISNLNAMKQLLDFVGDQVVAAIFTGPEDTLVPPRRMRSK